MNEEMNTHASPEPGGATTGGNERMMAIGSLVLGVISLCGFFLPIVGIPLAVGGIVLGILGRKDEAQKTIATVGIVVSIFGILLGCVPVSIIAIMRLLGPKIGNTFSSINSSLPN